MLFPVWAVTLKLTVRCRGLRSLGALIGRTLIPKIETLPSNEEDSKDTECNTSLRSSKRAYRVKQKLNYAWKKIFNDNCFSDSDEE